MIELYNLKLVLFLGFLNREKWSWGSKRADISVTLYPILTNKVSLKTA
jgi:hypothetical protein